MNRFNLNEDNLVFVLEKQEHKLSAMKGKDEQGQDEYYLEGIAAVFGEENNNSRIYDESEYLPHLQYLQEKITKKRLLGELDHPEKFDVSLKNISHVVEDLKYDKDSRTLRIRVKLLDTPAGKIAKSLVDAGIPISISSRAAGNVAENKRVQIKKIFTYDLVADPGFKDAQLERVYESLYESQGIHFSDHEKNSVIHGLECINESLGLEKGNGVEIYKVDNVKEFNEMLDQQDKNKSTTMDENKKKEFVTAEDLNNYSLIIKKEIDGIKSIVSSLQESNTSEEISTEGKNLEGRIEKLEKYSQYLAENLDNAINYGNYLSENLEHSVSYIKYLAEGLDRSISYGKYLAETLDQSISYSEHIGSQVSETMNFSKGISQRVDEGIKYAEYVGKNLDNTISYAEYLGEGLEKGLAYSEYLSEKLDQGIKYSEMLAENINRGRKYSDYLHENINRGFDHQDYLTEKLNRTIGYADYLAESMNSSNLFKAENINEKKQSVKSKADLASAADLNESGFAGDYTGLTDKVSQLLESVNTQKTETPKQEDAKTQKAQKQEVLNESENNEENTQENNVEKTGYKFIDEMPDEYRPVWEGLNPLLKDSIMAQASMRNLDTPYQIRDFWSTRNMGVKPIGLQPLNENQTPETEKAKRVPASMGYSESYMDFIAQSLEGRFGKQVQQKS